MIVLYHVPFGRGTRGKAALIERELGRLGGKGHALAVSGDEVELWITKPAAEFPSVKGTVCRGEIKAEQSRARQAARGLLAVHRNVALRKMHYLDGYLDRERFGVDQWWSHVG